METDIGNSNIDNGNSNIDSAADKKNSVSLRVTEGEYHKMRGIHKDQEIVDLEIKVLHSQLAVKKMAMKVLETEQGKISHRIDFFKIKKDKIKKELDDLREQIAKRLDIETLDPYYLNDETFELTHENDIDEEILNEELKS